MQNGVKSSVGLRFSFSYYVLKATLFIGSPIDEIVCGRTPAAPDVSHSFVEARREEERTYSEGRGTVTGETCFCRLRDVNSDQMRA